MRTDHQVIPFPTFVESSPSPGHIVSGGGISVNVKHQHPTYSNEKERLEQLQEIRKACIVKINGAKNSSCIA